MLYSTCPLCFCEAGIQVVRPEGKPELIVYYCNSHGNFSVTSSVDQRLRSLKEINARDSTLVLSAFEDRVMGHTQGAGDAQSYIPHFESVDD